MCSRATFKWACGCEEVKKIECLAPDPAKPGCANPPLRCGHVNTRRLCETCS